MIDTSLSPRWAFYPCRVDGRPASISVDLRFEGRPPPGKDTLFWVRTDMVDPGPNGTGTAEEAESFAPIEAQIADLTKQFNHIRVGRVRNSDAWLLIHYGPASNLIHLQEGVRGALRTFEGRMGETGARPDADWSYYRDFLCPGPAAREWLDRRGD